MRFRVFRDDQARLEDDLQHVKKKSFENDNRFFVEREMNNYKFAWKHLHSSRIRSIVMVLPKMTATASTIEDLLLRSEFWNMWNGSTIAN